MIDTTTVLQFLGALGIFSIGLRHAHAAKSPAETGGRGSALVHAALGGSGTVGVTANLPYLTVGAACTPLLAALLMGIPGLSTPSGLLTVAPALVLMASVLPPRRFSKAAGGLGLAVTGVGLAWRVAASSAFPPTLPIQLAAGLPLAALGLVAGVLLSVLYRSVNTAVLGAILLAVTGAVTPSVALGIVIGANGYDLVAGLRNPRRFGPAGSKLGIHYSAIHLTAMLLGGALAPAVLSAGIRVSAPVLAGFNLLVHGAAAVLFLKYGRFYRYVATRIIKMRRERPDGKRSAETPSATPTPESLDDDLDRVRSTLVKMADRASEMLMVLINASQLDEEIPAATDRIIALRGEVKRMEGQIVGVLTESVQLPCTQAQAERIQQQQRIAQELSLVGDDCYKTTRLFTRSRRKNYRFHQESRDELFDFTSQVLDFLRYIGDYLEGKITTPDWELANRMEDTIDSVRDKLKKRARNVLERNDDADIRGELTFIDIVAHLEHVGDRCQSIADTVRRIPGR